MWACLVAVLTNANPLLCKLSLEVALASCLGLLTPCPWDLHLWVERNNGQKTLTGGGIITDVTILLCRKMNDITDPKSTCMLCGCTEFQEPGVRTSASGGMSKSHAKCRRMLLPCPENACTFGKSKKTFFSSDKQHKLHHGRPTLLLCHCDLWNLQSCATVWWQDVISKWVSTKFDIQWCCQHLQQMRHWQRKQKQGDSFDPVPTIGFLDVSCKQKEGKGARSTMMIVCHHFLCANDFSCCILFWKFMDGAFDFHQKLAFWLTCHQSKSHENPSQNSRKEKCLCVFHWKFHAVCNAWSSILVLHWKLMWAVFEFFPKCVFWLGHLHNAMTQTVMIAHRLRTSVCCAQSVHMCCAQKVEFGIFSKSNLFNSKTWWRKFQNFVVCLCTGKDKRQTQCLDMLSPWQTKQKSDRSTIDQMIMLPFISFMFCCVGTE